MIYVAATAAIAARRAAKGHEFFAPKSYSAIAAFTGCDLNLCSVEKH